MVREDGIKMALSRCPVIRFPSSEETGGIKRFGEEEVMGQNRGKVQTRWFWS